MGLLSGHAEVAWLMTWTEILVRIHVPSTFFAIGEAFCLLTQDFFVAGPKDVFYVVRHEDDPLSGLGAN